MEWLFILVNLQSSMIDGADTYWTIRLLKSFIIIIIVVVVV